VNAPTANPSRKRSGLRAAFAGLRAGLQWRLLLLWTLGLLLPAVLATLPLWRALSAQFDHAVDPAAIAARLDVMAMFDAISAFGPAGGAIGGGLLGASLFVLLLAPFLTAMTLASIRSGRSAGFAVLLQGGVAEYWRMLRMTLWSLLPLGVALGLGAVAMKAADQQAADAILQADADAAKRFATIAMAVLFVFAHASVEAGRGVLGADPVRRSVVRAWGRGLMLLLRRPLATLLAYALPTLLAAAVALVFVVLRVQAGAGTVPGFIGGLLLAQLIVAALAWGRNARLQALADLARDMLARRAQRHGRARTAEPAHHAHALHAAPATAVASA
jgi:hypothetical protein